MVTSKCFKCLFSAIDMGRGMHCGGTETTNLYQTDLIQECEEANSSIKGWVLAIEVDIPSCVLAALMTFWWSYAVLQ